MAKMIMLLFCLSSLLLDFSESITLDCKYGTISWKVVENSYYCHAQDSFVIDSFDESVIEFVEDPFDTLDENMKVDGFYAFNRSIHYFPRKLDFFFSDLKFIGIEKSELKVIHQSDLKPFTKLVQLNLYSNQLEQIENNLFLFNPNLEYVSFAHNKISIIDSQVFNKLTNLRYLFLRENSCINMDAQNNQIEVQNVIQEAKDKCTESDSDETSYISSSAFSTIEPIENKFNAAYDIMIATKNQVSSLDNKIDKLVQKLVKLMNALKIRE